MKNPTMLQRFLRKTTRFDAQLNTTPATIQ